MPEAFNNDSCYYLRWHTERQDSSQTLFILKVCAKDSLYHLASLTIYLIVVKDDVVNLEIISIHVLN